MQWEQKQAKRAIANSRRASMSCTDSSNSSIATSLIERRPPTRKRPESGAEEEKRYSLQLVPFTQRPVAEKEMKWDCEQYQPNEAQRAAESTGDGQRNMRSSLQMPQLR